MPRARMQDDGICYMGEGRRSRFAGLVCAHVMRRVCLFMRACLCVSNARLQ